MPNLPTMKERIGYYDTLRGVAITAVVAIHSDFIGYTFDDKSFFFNITLIWRQMMNFAVPMFVAISGFFLANKKTDTLNEYFSFIKKQIPRVLIPYLMWSILYLGIMFKNGASIMNLAIRLFTFRPTTPFYFILLIIEFYMLLPFIQKLANKRGLVLSAFISLLGCFGVFYIRYYTNLPLPIFIEYNALAMLVFFVLGMYIRNNKVRINNFKLLIFIVLGFFLSVAETYFLYWNYGNITNNVKALKIGSFVYSTFLIIMLLNNKKETIPKFLAFLGQISFGVFLSHMFFMDLIRDFITKNVNALESNAIIYQFTLISTTLIISILFAMLVRNLDKQVAVKYLGQ